MYNFYDIIYYVINILVLSILIYFLFYLYKNNIIKFDENFMEIAYYLIAFISVFIIIYISFNLFVPKVKVFNDLKIDPNTTLREFINGTTFFQGFPPEYCFDNNPLTICESHKRRFPTFRVDLKKTFYLTRIKIYNNPDIDRQTLSPFILIIENDFRQQVFKQLIDETVNQETYTFDSINTEGRYVIIQCANMQDIKMSIADMDIYYKNK